MPRLVNFWPRGTGGLRNRSRKRKEGRRAWAVRRDEEGCLAERERERETHRIVRHVRRFYSRFHSTLHLETCQFASRTYRLIQRYVSLLGEIHLSCINFILRRNGRKNLDLRSYLFEEMHNTLFIFE